MCMIGHQRYSGALPLLSGVFVFTFFSLITLPISAQTVTGNISGTAADPAGQVISGARILLSDERTGSERTATTNEEGHFIFSTVQPGVYTIKIEHVGFRSYQRTNNVLSANEHLALGRLVLDVGNLTEVVTTTAEGARVETESSNLTARLTADQISLISTKGRDVSALLRLLPGVSWANDTDSVGEGFGTDLPVISGQRGRSNTAAVDGLMGTDISGQNKLSMTVNQDAVEEVKVLRNNYSAEFGTQGGAYINVVTKSGKKEYNGTAYYFIRNEALNANSFFNNKQGLPRGLYRHNIWGANLGGPVQIPWLYPNKEKKSLFFFYSVERPHTITPQNPRFVTVPTERERQGDFSQSFTGISNSGATRGQTIKAYVIDPLRYTPTNLCQATPATPDPTIDYQGGCFRDPSRATADNPLGLNIIPRNRLNPNGLVLLNFFPLSNREGGRTLNGNAFNYVVQKSVDVPKLSQVVRVDFKPTEKDNFYVRGTWWTSDNEGFDTSGWPNNDASRWGLSSHYLYKDNGLVANWVHVFSPTIVNETSIGVRHGSEGFIPSDGVIDRLTRTALKFTTPQFFPQNNRLRTIPRVTNWGGLSQTTVAQINWIDRWGEVGNDYVLPSISNDLTISRGDHNFKLGFFLERLRNGEAQGSNWTGTYNFNAGDINTLYTPSQGNTGHPYANALLGNFRQYTESSLRPSTQVRRMLIQWYGQDQWKINDRLTLNYGLRMGWFSHWRQQNDQGSVFDPTRFDPAKAPVLYRPYCVGGTPALAACANANRRAINPLTGEILTNTNLVSSFIPGVGDKLNGIVLGTDPNYPKGFREPAPIHWEPRFGFAWSLSENDKTVLRAHGGVYHSSRTGGPLGGTNSNPPFQRNVTIDYGSMDNLINLIGTSLERTTNLGALERHAKTPTIYNFSLGVQRDLGFKTIIEVSYVGSLARHLGEQRNINGVPDGARFVDLHPENRNPFSTGALPDEFLRPYPGYQDINLVTFSTTSNYNGLQVQVNRRYTSGFQFGIAYTYARAMDYANDDSSNVNFPRPYRAFNYGPSNDDQTHIFTANYIWDVPSLGRRLDNRFIKAVFDNWQLSGTTSLVSGQTKNLTVTYSGTNGAIAVPAGQSCPAGFQRTSPTQCSIITDLTGGEVNARMVMTCNPNRRVENAPDGTPVYIDISCLRLPQRGEIGNTPRNSLRRPGVILSDLALFKNIRLRERMNLQFRWETYNLFNHTNFGDIDAAATFSVAGGQIAQTNALFGQPTAAGVRPPRVMQGSLRLSF